MWYRHVHAIDMCIPLTGVLKMTKQILTIEFPLTFFVLSINTYFSNVLYLLQQMYLVSTVPKMIWHMTQRKAQKPRLMKNWDILLLMSWPCIKSTISALKAAGQSISFYQIEYILFWGHNMHFPVIHVTPIGLTQLWGDAFPPTSGNLLTSIN